MLNVPTSKKEFYSRYMLGEFGNKPESFDTLSDCLANGKCQEYGIRTRFPGGPFVPYVKKENLRDVTEDTVRRYSLRHSDLEFSGMQNDEDIAIQGYYYIGRLGHVFECSTAKTHMREALKDAASLRGETARAFVRHYLCPRSLDCLDELLSYEGTMYQSGVIEFSCYRVGVGLLGWNTIFWEARLY